MVAAFSCSVLAFLQYHIAARMMLASAFFIPGVMELVTAFGLVTAARSLSSDIDPWDSFYWWTLGIVSVVLGLVVQLRDDLIIHSLPVPFLINFPCLNIHNYYILGDMPVEIPFSAAFLLVLYVSFVCARQVVLRNSDKDIQQGRIIYCNISVYMSVYTYICIYIYVYMYMYI